MIAKISFPLRVVALYFLITVIWIGFSDQAVSLILADDVGLIHTAQTLKGWVFVLLTAFFLYFVLSQETVRRSAAEGELRKLSRVVEQSPSSVMITDTKGNIEYVNPKFTEVTGYAPDEVIGGNPNILKSGLNPPELYQDLWQCLRSGRQWRGEMHNRKKNGELFWESASIGPITAPDGTITHFLAVKEDITEFKKTQEQLIQSAKLATLGEMATSVAHELNQPLNVIRMAAGNVLRKIEKGKADPVYCKEKLDRIASQTERAAAIIDHMRAFGRKADKKPSELDLSETMRKALDLMGEQLRLAEIDVSLDLTEDCPPVMGHPVQMEQVILNLLTNARDAVMANGTEKKIALAVAGNDDGVRITVTDSGGGIPPNALEHLFEPFFTTKEVGKGTGLGLSVSYGIIDDMGGTIEAGNFNGGAKFTITLPAAANGKDKGKRKNGLETN